MEKYREGGTSLFFSAESPRRVTALYALEKGQFKGYYNFAAGDLFRIERTNGVVKYYQNGNLLYTSLVPSTTALMVDVSTDALGTSIENIRTSFTSKPASTIITNYVRDASGNVMAIYQSPLSSGEGTGLPAGQAGLRLIEQPIYGSSRLGMYTGGRKEGQRRLGQKNYELSNHLGNVLTVITDNINMSATDGVYATVVSATDYYPFGLEMEGRTVSNDSYRYGFNGKEKDAMGDAVYDYGFRIYNPKIAKFLSVDPLTKSYPMLTPYQFASNTPLQAIDLDGLEAYFVHGTTSNNRRWINNGDNRQPKENTKQLLRVSGNNTYNGTFKWGGFLNWGNGYSNNKEDRRAAAIKLVSHIMSSANGKEDITIVGHSHGGNVAIQAVPLLRKALDDNGFKDVKINIITVSTPADNSKGSSENPETHGSLISRHIHIYNETDVVQTRLANLIDPLESFERKYENKGTENVKLDVETIYTKTITTTTTVSAGHGETRDITKSYTEIDGVGAHGVDDEHPEVLKKAIDSGKIPTIKKK